MTDRYRITLARKTLNGEHTEIAHEGTLQNCSQRVHDLWAWVMPEFNRTSVGTVSITVEKLPVNAAEENSMDAEEWITTLVTASPGKYRYTDLLNIWMGNERDVIVAFWNLMDPEGDTKIKWTTDRYLVPTDGTETYF